MQDSISNTFSALADPTRRAILARLALGETSVTELAEPFEMSMPAVSKHLRVLEQAGLIERGRQAQYRPCRLRAEPLRQAWGWIEEYRQFWEESFDRLDAYLKRLQAEQSKETTEHKSTQLRKEKKNHGSKLANDEKAKDVIGSKPGYELNITRVFDAPRELVWKAWTDPEMVRQWMGPRGFESTQFETSATPGGRWHMTMVGRRPGSDTPVRLGQHGMVKEVRPPELLVFTLAWDDRSALGLPESPFKENIVTIRLEEQGGKTMMHFTQGPFATESERDGHTGGWNSSFDRFAEFMLAEQPARVSAEDDIPTELHLTRFFAAPRQLVFEAWTNAEMFAQWFGPRGCTVSVRDMEPKSGGKLCIDMHLPDGRSIAAVGKYVEFYPPHRFHWTSAVLGENGKPIFETWTSVFLNEVEGGTEVALDVHVTMSTPAAAPSLKGMRIGWPQTLDKLEEFVEKQVVVK